MLLCMRKLIYLLAFAMLGASAQALPHNMRWVGSWAASQQIPEPRNTLPAADLTDATVRQVVHLSLGGDEVRVRLSNQWGTQPLTFTSVHIARAVAPGSSEIDEKTDTAVTFGGRQEVTIPAGAEYVSDPVTFEAAPLSNVAITYYLKQAPARETSHPGSRATTYYEHGDHVSAAEMADAGKVNHWFELSGVEVAAPKRARCIVALGDSITDGHASGTNKNQRWPDFLAARLQANRKTRDVCVLNEGIGGNRLLHYGLGPAAAARIYSDVLSQPGAKYLIVLEGVNDLGVMGLQKDVTPAENRAMVQQMILAYEQMIFLAHQHGIEVIGGTIMPFKGSLYYHPDARIEKDREEVNAWIRKPGHFDKVIDFSKLMEDPADPERLNPKYDSGGHLHPGPSGYKHMADAIPLGWFAKD
jgi:lysophospholipase L1-like esterase